jgi:hypothetical protein
MPKQADHTEKTDVKPRVEDNNDAAGLALRDADQKKRAASRLRDDGMREAIVQARSRRTLDQQNKDRAAGRKRRTDTSSY